MSIVTIQVGQCGNQIGYELFRVYADSCRGASAEYVDHVYTTFFRASSEGQRWIPRAVMIDMEPKVVHQVTEASKAQELWSYEGCRSFTQQSGSANNWAYGFNFHGPKCSEGIASLILAEVEQCESIQGILVLSSVAGGTGSGLGAYITQTVRDLYPHLTILNCVVWPYTTGEVILQNYNAVLSLSHLDSLSDAIWVFENDHVDLVCRHVLKEKRTSFDALNGVIARNVASMLLPCCNATLERVESKALRDRGKTPDYVQQFRTVPDTTKWSRTLLDAVSHLATHPAHKLVTSKVLPQMPRSSVEFSTYSWQMITKHIYQMGVCNAVTEHHIRWDVSPKKKAIVSDFPVNKCVAASFVLRGTELAAADASLFFDPSLFVPWRPEPQVQLRACGQPFDKHEKFASLLMNSQAVVEPLESVLLKAHRTFCANAYVHQYDKHGVSADDFRLAFLHYEQILKNYKTL